MMDRWGLEGMRSFQQVSVSRKEEARRAAADTVNVDVNLGAIEGAQNQTQHSRMSDA